MSIFKYPPLLFCIISIFNSVHASVISKDWDDDRHRLQVFLSRNFDLEGNSFPQAKNNSEVIISQFKAFLDIFTFDYDLKFIYGKFLLKHDQVIEGLTQVAQYICFDDKATMSDADYFTEQLKRLTIDGHAAKKHIEEIQALFKASTKLNPTPSRSSAGNKETLFNNVTALLRILEGCPTIACYEATLQIMFKRMLDSDYNLANSYVAKLYSLRGKSTSPTLKLLYAEHCLMPRKEYPQAIFLVQDVIGSNSDKDVDNPYRTSKNLHMLGALYLITSGVTVNENGLSYPEGAHERLKQAKQHLQEAGELAGGFDKFTKNDLILTQFYLQEFDEVIFNTKKLLDLSCRVEGFEKDEKIIKGWKTTLRLALQFSGRTEELSEILRAKQERALKRNKKMAEFIRAMQTQHREEQSNKAAANAKKQNTQPIKVGKSLQPSQNSSSNLIEETGFFEPVQKKQEQERQLEKKEKKKTRGTPDYQMVKSNVPVTQEQRRPLIRIESLTTNKNAQNTFNALFSKYLPNVKADGNVKISLNEITCLFRALKQEYDSSKGHGSHKKGTLNLGDAASQMIILTNITYLKPEQIKDLRLAFINQGVVPSDSDIVAKLRSEGLIN